ncbi:MAG: hypothetical protein DRH43_10245 [Deltaproteobacteria bacterium]|nr:MAG: hypothetical protein DRH43_10245 [Deltaproteobacteria bacterium]
MFSRQPPRYVLADDPDEGDAIITGIFIKKLTGRGDSERCLIVCPGNLLTYKWISTMSLLFNRDPQALFEHE